MILITVNSRRIIHREDDAGASKHVGVPMIDYYYYYYYYLLQSSFHSVAIVLTLVTNKNE